MKQGVFVAAPAREVAAACPSMQGRLQERRERGRERERRWRRRRSERSREDKHHAVPSRGCTAAVGAGRGKCEAV